jgi:thiamine biosynthesis lipoprotein
MRYFSLVLLAFVLSCSNEVDLTTLEGRTMGTTYRVLVRSESAGFDAAKLHKMIDQELIYINKLMSTYDVNSEISRFNRSAQITPFKLSSETTEVLAFSLQLARQTQGAFDPTVSPLVNLWGFGPVRSDAKIPPADAISRVRAEIGFDALALDATDNTLRSQLPRQLDLSAVAKGYAVDRLAAILIEAGLSHFLVEVGGELVAKGTKFEDVPWRVAIESPDPVNRGIFKALSLRDKAVATSGDYRNFFESNGQRYSHTLDPRTGSPVDHTTVSVTVLADTAMVADGWATALNVLGLDEGLKLANERGLAALFISRTDTSERRQSYESDTMKAYLEEAR